MILRRIAEHVKAQNWFAVAIDFVIVVVGVFVGLQVSNLNAARQDRTRAHDYFERILSDLKLDIDQLDKRVAYWGKVRKYGAGALDRAEGGPLVGESAWSTVIAFYQASQVWSYSRITADLALIDREAAAALAARVKEELR